MCAASVYWVCLKKKTTRYSNLDYLLSCNLLMGFDFSLFIPSSFSSCLGCNWVTKVSMGGGGGGGVLQKKFKEKKKKKIKDSQKYYRQIQATN